MPAQIYNVSPTDSKWGRCPPKEKTGMGFPVFLYIIISLLVSYHFSRKNASDLPLFLRLFYILHNFLRIIRVNFVSEIALLRKLFVVVRDNRIHNR